MAVDRPTFHEAWYRVAQLRPRLLSAVRVYRRHFRGRPWYVLENAVGDQFSRLNEAAYRFIGVLDGRRTVAEAWRLCNEQLADAAPTQGEVIRLLGQLHAANLLYVELPPDSEALFSRYRKRVRREIQGYLANLLFVRVPLLDPDRLLDRWVSLFGLAFTWPGLVLWLALIATGLYLVLGNFAELISQSADVLDPGNLVFLYLSFALTKVLHEFSHAFACKKFGRLNGNAGQVHKMGVMFLVFFPLPYVDASSAWTFRGKWQRAVTGMAGVMAELAVAAVAAVIWATTSTGTLHIIAYNVIFVASVSTLLFNGNPLLRFDAYYVLSDLTEIPNLAQRCRQYLYYLVKRYVWGMRNAWSPAHSFGERMWFVLYGPASVVFRVYISIRILLFLNNRLPEALFILVPLLALSAAVAWALVPLGKFVRYLMTGPELARNRPRALVTSLGMLMVLAALLGVVKLPDHRRVEGIVEPVGLSIVYAEADGFVVGFLPSQTQASPDGPPLIQAVNPALEAERKGLEAQRQALQTRRRQALLEEVAAAQIYDEQLAALAEKIARVEQQLTSLNLTPSFPGTWVSPEIDRARGQYVRRGDRVGILADLDDLLIRATAGQSVVALLIEQADGQVEIRAAGRPEQTVKGVIEHIFPAGQQRLPSEALGYTVGGAMPVDVRDPQGTRTAEKFFEIRIRPNLDDTVHWRTGQRVVARFTLRPKPLAAQLWHRGRQLFQRRFRI